MKVGWILMIAAAILVAALGIFIYCFPLDQTQKIKSFENPSHFKTSIIDQKNNSFTNDSISTEKFIDSKILASYLGQAREIKSTKNIFAGIVNHHALAADLMANFFRTIKSHKLKIERIIIVSPDHFFAANNFIVTHERSYSSVYGQIDVDVEFVQAMSKQGYASIQNGKSFENEHGIGALIPFIKHEFSMAKIVPLLIKNQTPSSDMRGMGNYLAKNLEDDDLIIISADMSHNLSALESGRNDAEMIFDLNSWNIEKMGRATDQFVDNAKAFYLLDSFFKAKKISPIFKLLDHSNSAKYGTGDKTVTSYITGIWSD